MTEWSKEGDEVGQAHAHSMGNCCPRVGRTLLECLERYDMAAEKEGATGAQTPGRNMNLYLNIMYGVIIWIFFMSIVNLY